MVSRTRPSWDQYFMGVAELVASRSTCPRLHVGAVLVVDRQIMATGYNGSAPGLAHCMDVGCEMIGDSCQRTLHAEVNAIGQAAKRGVPISGATAFVTHNPCINCAKALASAGVSEVRYLHYYPKNASLAQEVSGLVFIHHGTGELA